MHFILILFFVLNPGAPTPVLQAQQAFRSVQEAALWNKLYFPPAGSNAKFTYEAYDIVTGPSPTITKIYLPTVVVGNNTP